MLKCTKTFSILSMQYERGHLYSLSEVLALPVLYQQYFREANVSVNNARPVSEVFIANKIV